MEVGMVYFYDCSIKLRDLKNEIVLEHFEGKLRTLSRQLDKKLHD